MPYGDVPRSLVRRSSLFYDVVEPPYARTIAARWQHHGAPIPASGAVKRDMLRRVAQQHHLRFLIETGTYTGDTVMALCRHFDRIVSVELSAELHAKAVRQTRRRRNVELLLGDSAKVLAGVLGTLRQPALFWLDAHYSGGVTAMGETISPISAELDLILGHAVRGHVVLVDDAREFHYSARSGYPAAEAVAAAARQHDNAMAEKYDIFSKCPPRSLHSSDRQNFRLCGGGECFDADVSEQGLHADAGSRSRGRRR